MARPRVSAHTTVCGVILHPAGHTRSPAMHNAAFEALGLDAVYLAFDVPPAQLKAAIDGMRSLGIRQLAVSIPHKRAVMDLIDEVDETAERIGAVNTITRDGDRLVGTNTDWLGVVTTLEQRANAQLEGARVIVLGAGGAARAAVFGLQQRGALVTVLNRTEAKAAALVGELGATASGPLTALADHPHDILINTTSVGLKEDVSVIPKDAIQNGTIVFDSVYDPAETKLLRDAAERGAITIGGKWWLVHQGAAQLAAWTKKEAPIDAMAHAFDDAD